jgi:hypothetical protein
VSRAYQPWRQFPLHHVSGENHRDFPRGQNATG